MTKFIGIVSAKGGVGKTTTTINLTSALSFLRRDIIALDANFANPDLGIHLGIAGMEKNMHSALRGKDKIKDCIYRHPSGIKVIPGSLSYREARQAQRKNLITVIYELVGSAEAVIIDSTPGMGRDSQEVIKASDYLIIVSTPDICSVTDSLKMIRLAEELNTKVLGIVINKKREEGYEMSEANIAEFLKQPVIGVIPDDNQIRYSLKTNTPLINVDPNSVTAGSYKKLAATLIGEKYSENIEQKEETSMFRQILRNLGLSR